MKILAFGEILWDVIEGTEHLGGAPFNFAVHSVQCGNESSIISKLGRDLLGKRAYDASKTHGVDVSLIQWDDVHQTGVVDVTLSQGQPDYVIRRDVAYDFIQEGSWTADLQKREFDVFYFGSLAQRNSVSFQTLHAILAQNRFRHVFYDVNVRKGGFTSEIIHVSLAACTIFKLNIDEVAVISQLLTGSVMTNENFCKHIKTRYPNIRLVIITASEKGCFIYEDELLYIPGTPVTVQDAVGAGDAFSASFMHIYGSTGDALRAAQIANQVGAFVATRGGAIPEYAPHIKSLLGVEATSAPEHSGKLDHTR